jgi:uncharacterized protein (DUF952 family)/protein associated with RNAse G/E
LDEATIYHITTHEAWRAAREAGIYRADSLDTEGFIHCSTLGQVANTAGLYFAGAMDLVVLSVDVSLLRSEVRYEESGHGTFPHIYGPLDLVAVRSAIDLTPGTDGTFVFGPGGTPDPAKGAPEESAVRVVQIVATNYDGSPHWSHPARLLHANDDIVITATSAGLPIQRVAGPFTSPFNTRAHYWPDRWFNVIRLEEPGRGLTGYYCNIAAPVQFDGANVCYVDLQLDVRVYVASDGTLTWTLLDEDEFEAARLRYGYDEELVAKCKGAVAQIVAMVESKAYPFDG